MSLLLALAKIIAGLTTERALILFICAAAGWMFYTRDQHQMEDKAQERRQFEESKERDRQHCDSREDKVRAEQIAEAERLRAWYAQMAESQRKFEGEQREKDRASIAELARVIAKKVPDLP